MNDNWRELDPAELVRQYDNRSAVPEHPQIFADWEARSAIARVRLDGQFDLTYGEHPRERLDLFLPQSPTGGVHLFIHGGYWQALGKEHFSFIAEPLLAQGEIAVVCSYPLCPEVGVGEILSSLRRLVVWLHREIGQWGGDAARLTVSGHSAGGHLAACLLGSDWVLEGLAEGAVMKAISLSGLFELEPLRYTPINDALQLDEESARAFSPALWPRPVAGDLQLLVGSRESDEYWRQSRLLMQVWDGGPELSLSAAQGCHHFAVLDWFCQRYPAL